LLFKFHLHRYNTEARLGSLQSKLADMDEVVAVLADSP
jgi:hypothetical protein